jgi:hypothetical protein
MTAPATAPTTAVKSNVITNLDASPMVRASAGGGAFGRIMRAQTTYTPAATQATSVLARMVRIPSNCIVSKVEVLLDGVTTADGYVANVGLWYSDAQDGTSLVNVGNLTAISSAFFASAFDLGQFSPVMSSLTSGDGTITSPSADDGTTVQLGQGFVDITFANTLGAMTDGQYIPSQSYLPIWQAVSNSLALQTTPVGAFTATSLTGQFTVASAGGSVYVQGQDPGGYFDIGIQLAQTGIGANVKLTMRVEIVVPG